MASTDPKTTEQEKPADEKLEQKPAALGEDDEFEDFPVEDWPEDQTEAAKGSGETKHLWEESWDDDDTSDDFSHELNESHVFLSETVDDSSSVDGDGRASPSGPMDWEAPTPSIETIERETRATSVDSNASGYTTVSEDWSMGVEIPVHNQLPVEERPVFVYRNKGIMHIDNKEQDDEDTDTD
ncbi:hypothetical protein F66182_7806 [Fusarium sp. NRRL 66182]|nr:hypothetical protein F66182_7806 [Fusarium sp. NRRL 66182]